MRRLALREARPSTVEGAGRDRWLLSYGDFMTLLLALFVVLYASARVDAEKNQSLFAGLQAAFVFDAPSPSLASTQPVPRVDEPTAPASIAPLSQLEADLREALEHERTQIGEDLGASLHQSERGLVISLASAEFFPAGGVEVADERKAVLSAIAPFLQARSGALHFEGHTDDQPITSDRFPSNWELSTARAAAIARFFIEEHDIAPPRVATTGYAQFRPVAPNDEAANRARNRRVEIVVFEDGEVVPGGGEPDQANAELDRLLGGLPPIPEEADDSLKPKDLGPPPADIPLP